MLIRYVSFYTKKYADDAQQLVRCLEALDLEFHIVPKKFPGKLWEEIAQGTERLTFVDEMLNKYPDQSIAWIDCDARLIKRPWLLEQVAGGAHGEYDFSAARRPGGNLVGSLMWFENNLTSRQFIQVVTKRIKEERGTTELGVMNQELNRVKYFPLPPEYCVVPYLSRLENPVTPAGAVLVHLLRHTYQERMK